MNVELFDYTQDAEYKIGYAAAECYDAKLDRESCLRRAKKCKDEGHLSTLRFAIATFRISGISRVCSHQLVRHAHLSYLQKSQRYVAEKSVDYIDPPAVAGLNYNDQLEWASIQDKAETLYLNLVGEKKLRKEDARFILPQGCDTSLFVTGNLQAWLDFVKLRTDKHSQWEINSVANEIRYQLATHVAPNIFGD